MVDIKKRLTQSEEFEIMKLVLDKFLWLGIGIMAWGLYKIMNDTVMSSGLTLIMMGAIILILFLILLVKEFEIYH